MYCRLSSHISLWLTSLLSSTALLKKKKTWLGLCFFFFFLALWEHFCECNSPTEQSGTRSLIWTLVYVKDDGCTPPHEQLTFIGLKRAFYTSVQLRDCWIWLGRLGLDGWRCFCWRYIQQHLETSIKYILNIELNHAEAQRSCKHQRPEQTFSLSLISKNDIKWWAASAAELLK